MPSVEVPNTGTRHSTFPKYQITLGPWLRGLNSSNDPTLLGSDELAECTNFVIQNDGRMRIRPPAARQYPDDIFWDLDFTKERIQALGSVALVDENVVPVVAKFSLPSAPDGGEISFWHYGEVTAGDIPAIPAWKESYDRIEYPFTPDEIWYVPVQVILYDLQHFLLFNKVGFAVAESIGSPFLGDPDTGNLMGPARVGTGGGDTTFLRKAVLLKDRICFHTDKDVYWSTINPTGVANDWSTTAPYSAGFLGINREITHDKVHDIIVYQNELYILGSGAVSKLSWNTDPGIDGEFVIVSADLGGQTFAICNGDLYVFNGFGLYRLVTSYFVEVSGSVRDYIRSSCKGQPGELPALDGASGWDERPVVGMYHLDNLLLIGPLNADAPLRHDDVEGTFSCNSFLVYNVDTETWTKWQFSPNGSDSFPIAGPSQAKIMRQCINDPAFTDAYVWVGRTLVNGTTVGDGVYGQAIYTMPAVANLLTDVVPVGWDDGGPSTMGGSDHVIKHIGLLLKTCSVDLGDSDSWKRVQTSLIDARQYTAPSLSSGAVVMGYILDDISNYLNDRFINLAAPEIDRLAFGGAYRCHRFGFRYDSLTGTAASAENLTDLDLIKKISFYLTLSRKDVAGRA